MTLTPDVGYSLLSVWPVTFTHICPHSRDEDIQGHGHRLMALSQLLLRHMHSGLSPAREQPTACGCPQPYPVCTNTAWTLPSKPSPAQPSRWGIPELPACLYATPLHAILGSPLLSCLVRKLFGLR